MFSQDLFSIFNQAPKKDDRNKQKQFEVKEPAPNQLETPVSKKVHTDQQEDL